MSILAIVILAFSMSADAFAVALCKGAAERNPQFGNALKTGAVFGIIEGITPVAGWWLGAAASNYSAAYDRWVAFILLTCIGLKMIHESFYGTCETKQKARPAPLKRLILTACATSIDAFAVGVTLAFMDANIWLCSASIGMATFTMVTLGIMMGHHLGNKLGRYTEALSGVALITIGALIVCEHLTVL